MECDEAMILISVQIDDELSGFERRALRAHLERCAGCRAASQELQTLQGEVHRLPKLSVPTGLRSRVAAAVERRRAEDRLWDIVMTARGRMLVERKGEALWTSPRLSHPDYRLRS
ncbi:MAG: zf-HC2 domain-containing protein [Anaerolineae bacterium]